MFSLILVFVAMPITRWEFRIVPCRAGGNASATCLKIALYYCNVRSLRNRLIYLLDVFYGHNYNIITLTETWLSDEITDGLLDPKGLFAIFRRDRVYSHPSGGILNYVLFLCVY